MLEMVSATRFKTIHRGRKNINAPATGIRKIMESPAVDVDGTRGLRFCISTGAVDRERDTINQAGWDFTHYRNNPVVLWAHQSQMLPIGRAVDLAVENGRCMATVHFVPGEMPVAGELAEAVYRMAQQGWLRATSVGFRPLEWDFTDDKDRGADDWFPGIDFQRQELVEFSVCTVPANPEALIELPPADAPPVAPTIPSTEDTARAIAVMRARRRRIAEALGLAA